MNQREPVILTDLSLNDEVMVTITGTVLYTDGREKLDLDVEGTAVSLMGSWIGEHAEITVEIPPMTEPEAIGAMVIAYDDLTAGLGRWISVEPITVENRWYPLGSLGRDGLDRWSTLRRPRPA